MQPLRLGPDAPRPAGDDDLWRIVTFDGANASAVAPGDMSASFEAALQQVDAHLESLVQTEVPQARAPAVAPTVKARVQATPGVSPGSPAPAPSPAVSTATPDQTGAAQPPDDWDDLALDEDDLAGEPTDEASKLRRQRLLQRTMEALGPAAPRPTAAPGSLPLLPRPRLRAPLPERRPRAVSTSSSSPSSSSSGYADVQAKRDHFTMLGLTIGPEVTREQVKTAFLGLAKRFHPDRLPPALSALAPKMTAVFEAIREAYEVLYDDAKRAAYLQELRTRVRRAERPPGPAEWTRTTSSRWARSSSASGTSRPRWSTSSAPTAPTPRPCTSPPARGPSTWTRSARPRLPRPSR